MLGITETADRHGLLCDYGGPDLAAEQEALEEAISDNPMPIAYLVALAAEIAERAPQSAHEVLDEWRSRALRQIETGA